MPVTGSGMPSAWETEGDFDWDALSEWPRELGLKAGDLRRKDRCPARLALPGMMVATHRLAGKPGLSRRFLPASPVVTMLSRWLPVAE